MNDRPQLVDFSLSKVAFLVLTLSTCHDIGEAFEYLLNQESFTLYGWYTNRKLNKMCMHTTKPAENLVIDGYWI
jgi:hypothetical protein